MSVVGVAASCSDYVRLTSSVLAWTRGGSPSNIAPARMPGVYAQRLYARTHTSGRTKSVQDAPTTNDHNCTDAKPTKHTQPFTRGKGLGIRQGCRDRTPKGFMQGRIQVVEQSRCRTHRQQTTTIAETQSPQSVLIVIENLLYFYTDFFYKLNPTGCSCRICFIRPQNPIRECTRRSHFLFPACSRQSQAERRNR